MQPTLMGSSEAGIYDRLLVDKLTPAIREPQRWDVTVFGYPLQQNQNYVKRLVGLPGVRKAHPEERLRAHGARCIRADRPHAALPGQSKERQRLVEPP